MRYHNITKDDMLNGDGLRVVLWVSGCSHCCKDCQNPLTWDPNGGLLFDEQAKEELFADLDHDYISGITFSGGDPLYPSNEPVITALAREIRERFPDKTIWLYTGYLWETVRKLKIAPYLDVVVDGEYERDKRELKLHWRGSTNQRVVNVQESLRTGRVVLHCD